MMRRNDLLVWIDIEATGLDTAQDELLEVCVVLTTMDLSVVAQFGPIVLHCSEERLQKMSEWPTKQHLKTGLWNESIASTLTVEEAEKQVVTFISAHCIPGSSPLCGNSVSFDRAMLQRWMPGVFSLLHYRIIDVSTIKELVRRWYGDSYVYQKKETHRAKEDILESIEELKWYREKVFVSQSLTMSKK